MQIAISNELLLVIVLALILVLVLVFLIPAARNKRDNGDHDDGPIVQDYSDQGIKVTLGWQGFQARILRIPYPPPDEMPKIKVADQPWPRVVRLNVAVARQDTPDILVTHFDPKLVVEMTYSAEDLRIAQEYKLDYPVFGFWDGCAWVLFTAEKHGLTYHPAASPTNEVAGYAQVSLSEWSDPAIGHGP